MSMHWMMQQLAKAGSDMTAKEVKQAAFNPKPPGSVQTMFHDQRSVQPHTPQWPGCQAP